MHLLITSALPLLLVLNFTSCFVLNGLHHWQFEKKIPTDAPPMRKGGCAHPSRPEHGIHNGYRFPEEALIPVEEKIRYRCYTGHDLIGDRTRKCLKDGTWSGKEPWCNLTSCGKLYSPENGRTVFGDSVKIGSKIRFECNKGYGRIGASEAVCLKTGRWSVRPPWCKPLCYFVKCPFGQKFIMNQTNLQTKCTCKKNALECPFEYKPICGSDGVTYASRCIMGMVSCLKNRHIKKVSNGCFPKGHHEVEDCSPCPKIKICKALYGSNYAFLGKITKKEKTADGTFLHFRVEEFYKGSDNLVRGKMATVFMKTSNGTCSCVPDLPYGKLYVFGQLGITQSGIIPFIDELTYVEKFYSHNQMSLCWLH